MSAKGQAGITSVPFLQIEPDSRGAGMGNANVAISDNASAVFWNPAGLAFQKGTQISITHSNWLPQFDTDLFYDYLVGKMYVDGIGTIGGHVTFLNLGEQVRTNEDGTEEGTFRSYELAVGGSYGYRLSDNWAIGTGLRFIYSNLVPSGTRVSGQEARAGTSVGLDLAGMYRSDEFDLGGRDAQVSVGANLSNFGPGIQYTDAAQKDPLPTVLRAGWAFTTELDPDGYNTLTISNDFPKVMARIQPDIADGDTVGFKAMSPFEALFNSWDTFVTELDNSKPGPERITLAEQIVIGVGLEYWYNKQFALRSGYFYESPNNGDRQFLTFGAGLRYDIFGVDFSYIASLREQDPLADTIRFSVLVDF